MSISWRIVVALGLLEAGAGAIRSGYGAVAAAPGDGVTPGSQRVVDSPASRVEEATTRQVAVLTALLVDAPERAHTDLERALAGARRGRDATHAALGSTGDRRGLVRARKEVSAAFRRSISTLSRLAERKSEGSAVGPGNALVQVRQQRAVALENFDLLLADSSRGGSGADLADRRTHPTRPDHRVQPVGSSCHPHAPPSRP